MSINVKQFETLRERFPTWDALKAHFESEDGVGLRVIEQDGFALIRYEKSTTVDKIYRSVVWDTAAHLPLCVAPFRSSEGPPPFGPELVVEDFVDGFMMNAWVKDGVLRVATRTRIGGENFFYSHKTFGEMFLECLANTTLKTADALRDCLEGLRADVGGVSAFVSFVVQHPEHRVVAKVSTPGLSVVHTGYVMPSGAVCLSEKAVHWPEALARLQIGNYASRSFDSQEDIDRLLLNTAAQRGWRWQGLVFKDGTGSRWKIRTPTYLMLRQLRGGEATSMERFFRLRSEHKVVEYLKHYGEDRERFWNFEQKIRLMTTSVLGAYTDVHKAHMIAFKDLPEALRPAVFLLHAKWRDELRPKGFSVRLQNAIDVVSSLRPFEKKRLMEADPYVAAPSITFSDLPALEVVESLSPLEAVEL